MAWMTVRSADPSANVLPADLTTPSCTSTASACSWAPTVVSPSAPPETLGPDRVEPRMDLSYVVMVLARQAA